MLAPFAKKPLNLTLTGVTTDDKDLSVITRVAYFSALVGPQPAVILGRLVEDCYSAASAAVWHLRGR